MFDRFSGFVIFGLIVNGHAIAAEYDYDKIDRLTQVQYDSGQVISYSYDPAGNLTAVQVQGDAVDVTATVTTAISGLRLNRRTGVYSGTITLTNAGADPIVGPILLLLRNLSPSATLANATGQHDGAPYLSAPAPDTLAPGASVVVPVAFTVTANQRIDYTPMVYAGTF